MIRFLSIVFTFEIDLFMFLFFFYRMQENINKVSEALKSMNLEDNGNNITSSRDSINAILQSDVENIETDVEEITKVNVPFSDTPTNFEISPRHNIFIPPSNEKTSCYVSGNSNLIVNHLNDNFCSNGNEIIDPKLKSKQFQSNLKKSTSSGINSTEKNSRNKDLEKRKLSQNLDNFSLRLGQSLDNENTKKITADNTLERKKHATKSSTIEEKSTE